MPGPLLHVGATLICAHAGQAQPTVPNPRVLVSAQPTVTQPGPWVVTGCSMPPPPGGNGPCVTATFVTGSVRVLSLAQPLLLMDSVSIAVPTGTPLTPVVVQPRVIAT
jgi:hypothetical protein